MFSSIGGLINDVMGVTSAGKQNQKYTLEQMGVNNAYQKEFAQNAHQWQVEDLKKAGLNPVLSAGGSGASASGGGGTSGTGMTAGAGAFSEIMNSAMGLAKLDSETNLLKAQADNQTAGAIKAVEEAGMIKPQAEAQIRNLTTNSALNKAKQQEAESRVSLNSAEKALKEAETQRAKGTKEYYLGIPATAAEKGYTPPTKEQRAKGYLY